MALHLLPKKSWHVWNEENLQRVARDEAAAAAAADVAAARARAAASEARLATLRERAAAAAGAAADVVAGGVASDARLAALRERPSAASEDARQRTGGGASGGGSGEGRHLNLFAGTELIPELLDVRAGAPARAVGTVLRKDAVNPEFEAERKAAEARARRAAGIHDWTFADVTKGGAPWYAAGGAVREGGSGTTGGELYRTAADDPLTAFRAYSRSTRVAAAPVVAAAPPLSVPPAPPLSHAAAVVGVVPASVSAPTAPSSVPVRPAAAGSDHRSHRRASRHRHSRRRTSDDDGSSSSSSSSSSVSSRSRSRSRSRRHSRRRSRSRSRKHSRSGRSRAR